MPDASRNALAKGLDAQEIAENFQQFTETMKLDHRDLGASFARFYHPNNENVDLSFTVCENGTIKVHAYPGTLNAGTVQARCKDATDAILTARAYLDSFFDPDYV